MSNLQPSNVNALTMNRENINNEDRPIRVFFKTNRLMNIYNIIKSSQIDLKSKVY